MSPFLEQVRLRPGMWVRWLEELHSILIGYCVAIVVHGLDEEVDFRPLAPFSEWLWAKLGRHSPLGWAVEIEREAEAASANPIDLFFTLVDEYRSQRRTVADLR